MSDSGAPIVSFEVASFGLEREGRWFDSWPRLVQQIAWFGEGCLMIGLLCHDGQTRFDKINGTDGHRIIFG